MVNPDRPKFDVGKRHLLFLDHEIILGMPSSGEYYTLVGLVQGQFAKDGNGQYVRAEEATGAHTLRVFFGDTGKGHCGAAAMEPEAEEIIQEITRENGLSRREVEELNMNCKGNAK